MRFYADSRPRPLEQSGACGEREQFATLHISQSGRIPLENFRGLEGAVESAEKIGFSLTEAKEIPGRRVLQDLEQCAAERLRAKTAARF